MQNKQKTATTTTNQAITINPVIYFALVGTFFVVTIKV